MEPKKNVKNAQECNNYFNSISIQCEKHRLINNNIQKLSNHVGREKLDVYLTIF